MNNSVQDHTSQTTTGALAFAIGIGAAIIAGPPAWPKRETPRYMVTQTAPSYSQFSEQLMTAAKQHPSANFARDIAAIYMSLNERQERLGEDFEAAIFDDLDSLYES